LISDNIFHFKNETKLELQIPEEHFSRFVSFLEVFRGRSFPLRKFSLQSLFFLIESFGFSSLLSFISTLLKSSSSK
jgi:hypothetical protein